MKHWWRFPTGLSAVIILAQLLRVSPIVDVVVPDRPVGSVHLTWPITHILFAPFTLLADWLNGGSRWDLETFGVWLVLGYVLWRLMRRRADAQTRVVLAEARSAGLFLAACGLFVWWGARWNRPIPRLVAADSSLIIFDIHSHTSASHDGRAGFGSDQNARWHARAGFDAAFITDHNVTGADKQWRLDGGGRPPRLLPGEELSLSGLHIVVLGVDQRIDPSRWAGSFDSSLALVDSLSHQPSAISHQPYLIASLPEFWEHHWGPDLGRLADAGVRGFEIWTTSPRAMDFPAADRRTLIDRARASHLELFGATDMHGLGNTAGVWNVMELPGWRVMDDAALTRALIVAFETNQQARVVALTRFGPEGRLAGAFAAPLGVFTALRAASPWHALSLLLWIWGVALVRKRRAVP